MLVSIREIQRRWSVVWTNLESDKDDGCDYYYDDDDDDDDVHSSRRRAEKDGERNTIGVETHSS